ncbi:MAG: hypothetical protein WCK42_04885 [Myxococcaceae bacterium]
MTPIRFEHIPDVGLSLEQDFDVNTLSELLAEPDREISYQAIAPAHVHFHLERAGKDVLLTGTGSFRLSHPCVRCLEDLEIEYELVLDLKLEHPEKVDVEELMREELFLELPHYPACDTACLN